MGGHKNKYLLGGLALGALGLATGGIGFGALPGLLGAGAAEGAGAAGAGALADTIGTTAALGGEAAATAPMAAAAPGMAGAFGPTASQAAMTGLLDTSATPMITQQVAQAGGLIGDGVPSVGFGASNTLPELARVPTFGDRAAAFTGSNGFKAGMRGLQLANSLQQQPAPAPMPVQMQPRPSVGQLPSLTSAFDTFNDLERKRKAALAAQQQGLLYG